MYSIFIFQNIVKKIKKKLSNFKIIYKIILVIKLSLIKTFIQNHNKIKIIYKTKEFSNLSYI